MPTQNSTQTYEMLKTYLDETADSFEKLDEEPGFLYRKTDGRTSLVFCARVDKELGFLLLSAYPGILVRTSYVPMVADYCQRITPEVGVVCVESNLCEVYYRTEVAFEHAPVSRATLELLERTAFAALTPHISALRSLSAGVLPEALPEPQEIHIPSPAPSHAEDFLPLMEEYFQRTHFTVLAKHAPDETGACYLYEFLAAHRRWKLHVTLNDEKTFFILRLFPGRNALVFDPRYLHAAAQICNAENDSVKSGALFVGRRPEGLCAKMALSALEVPTSLEETLYSAVSILVSLLYSREAELQKAAAGVSNLRRSMHSIILILVNVIDQSACSDNLLHEGRKRLSFELPVLRLVGDDTGIEIDFDLITRLNCFCRLRAFDNRQSDIDRITVKNPGKGLCNNTADASRLDRNRRMLSGRTAAEVFIRNNDIAGLYVFDEILVNILHAVLCKLCRIGGI